MTSSTSLRDTHALAASLATLIVAVALLGPPLTGLRLPTLVELRHDVLMIDREFERSSMRINAWFARTATFVQDDVKRAGSTRSKTQLREAML
jgi:hypothetical protein